MAAYLQVKWHKLSPRPIAYMYSIDAAMLRRTFHLEELVLLDRPAVEDMQDARCVSGEGERRRDTVGKYCRATF